MKKSLIFSGPGLGDSLVSFVLANNLARNGWGVTVLQEREVYQLGVYFPSFVITKELPCKEEEVFEVFDRVFIFYDTSSLLRLNLVERGKKDFPEKIVVVSPTHSKKDPLFYEDTKFSRELCMAENLEQYCRNSLKLEQTTREIGWVLPETIRLRKEKRRVIFHCSSATKGRRWGIKKFLKLSRRLKKEKFLPVFVFSAQEKEEWEWLLQRGESVRFFSDLKELVPFVYESDFMIGNDSGIGHLASSLGVPGVSIFRGKRICLLWKPGWSQGKFLCPPWWVPNFSKFRLRDRKWQWFIPVRKVFKEFLSLTKY